MFFGSVQLTFPGAPFLSFWKASVKRRNRWCSLAHGLRGWAFCFSNNGSRWTCVRKRQQQRFRSLIIIIWRDRAKVCSHPSLYFPPCIYAQALVSCHAKHSHCSSNVIRVERAPIARAVVLPAAGHFVWVDRPAGRAASNDYHLECCPPGSWMMASSLPRILRNPCEIDWSWHAFILFLQFTQILLFITISRKLTSTVT